MNRTIFRIIWLSLLGLLSGCLLWRTIVPSGHVTYITDLSQPTYFFEKLLPAERVNNERIIIDEPVYFTVYTTRHFAKAIVTMNFNTPTPAFALGVAYNKAQWIYDFKTIQENTSQVKLEFDLKLAERSKGRYSFMISDPLLKKQTKIINIKDISVEFIGPVL